MNKKFDVYNLESTLDLNDIEYISTGIYQIDSALNGGIRRKELGTVLAQWQMGKSSILTIIGANCYNKGYKVLHLVLEDFWLDTQTAYKNITNKNSNGQLWIIDGSNQIVKTYDLENLIQEYKPDVVIIDYAELLKNQYNLDSVGKRHSLRENFIEFRRFASNYNCAVWTAHQATVANPEAGKAALRLDASRISECRAVGATTDILLGFALSNPFDQYLYVTIMKNKHRSRAIPDHFKLGVDFSKPRVWSL